MHCCSLFDDADDEAVNSTSLTTEPWNITEASTLLHFMDHICKPRAEMSALFEKLKKDSPFTTRDYLRELEGKIIKDDMKSHFQKRKLLRFLKKVRYKIIPVQL
jgi:uncharacterized damage-inducible protein DinB